VQESDPCTQELDFTPDAVADGSTVNLRFVKFQNVTSLSVRFTPRLPPASCLAACATGPRSSHSWWLTPGDAQIFCGANFGNEEQTVIHRLVLFGLPGNLTDMGRWSEVRPRSPLPLPSPRHVLSPLVLPALNARGNH